MGVEKLRVARGGKNIIFRRGGGGGGRINIVFRPKYRPLVLILPHLEFFLQRIPL
jgi:hypothetical protein